MSYLHEINERFPIRKRREQKDEFLNWALQEAEKLGYRAKVEELGDKKQHRNLVVGNLNSAKTVFTAHYDTPANNVLPNIMMPRNIPLFLLYQIFVVCVLLIISFAAMALGAWIAPGTKLPMLLYLVVYFGLLMLLMRGPANKHNANDNTSGVAAVFSLMASLPTEERRKAAFILFDNEEKGKLGSKAYAKEHKETASLKLFVNMDCVGVGDHILVLPRRMARIHPLYERLEKAFHPGNGKQALFFSPFGTVCNSDHKNFECGVAIVACKKAPVVGYYAARIHTSRDTVADEANIAYLAENLTAFVQSVDEE